MAKYTLEQLQALMNANKTDSSTPDLSELLAASKLSSGGTGMSNAATLSALTNKPMGINPYMAIAGGLGAAIPFVQALRLGKEVKQYQPTNMVPRQAYDVVQNLSQQLNAPVTNYGQRVQELNDARAARIAYAKKAGNSSDFLKALYSSEDMYNKGMRQLGMQGAQEQISRRAAYNAALANLGAQEAASAQKNREALAALKQARDVNYAKSAEGLINNLLNSVVLKSGKKSDGTTETPDYTDFFNNFMTTQNKSGETTPNFDLSVGKPQLYQSNFQFDPALTQRNNYLYPVIK